MKLKQLLSLLLALIMAVSVVSVFASCRIGGEDEPETTAPSQSKVTCETVTESGSVIADFTYYAIVGEDGVMTLYKTAAGRDNADAGELVTDVAVAVTAQGVEVATPIAAGSSSMQIEVYRFDRDFEEESVSDPKGNVYLLAEYGYKFATDTDIALLENVTGKTVSILLAELNATITEATRRTLTVDQSGRFLCDVVTEGGVATNVFAYYGVIGEEGKVTLYKTAEGRENADASELVNDVAITVKATGIEVATSIPEAPQSKQTELYVFDKELPKYDGIPPIAGTGYASAHAEVRYASEQEKSHFDEEGYSSEVLFGMANSGRTVYFDTYGRMYSVKTEGDLQTVEWIYHFSVDENGVIIRYKTEAGRDSQDAADVVKDENSFFLSPDGRRMEWHQEILNGYSTKVVTFFDFLKTISENEPEVKNKIYLSNEETPLIWIFDRDLVLTGMQGSRVLYTYYGKIMNSNMIFYTDSDAREYDDQNYLVPDLAGIVLPCIDTIVLPDGTEVRYNAAYSNTAAPTLSFKSDIQTEYIAASRLSIDISESVVTNSDGGLVFEWFEGTGMWKEHIDHAPRTEGEYTLRVITKPTAQYAMAQKDIAITIISLEEMTAGYTAINMGDLIDRISNGLWFKTQKGQSFIINYTCDERKDINYCIHFTELSEGSQVRVLRLRQRFQIHLPLVRSRLRHGWL